MFSFASAFGSGLSYRLLLIGCCAALLAGCADSDRLTDPFSNPFRGDVDRSPTGSISAPPPAYASRPVESRPLAPPPGDYTSDPHRAYSTPAYRSTPVAAAHSWSGSDTATGAIHQNTAGWTAEGGMPIVVAPGEDAGVIARRYGIPTAALAHANGYASPSDIRPGAHIVIPTYNAALAASSGVRFSTAREEQSRAQERLHEARLHEMRSAPAVVHRQARLEDRRIRSEKIVKRDQYDRHEAAAAPVRRVYAHAPPPMPVDHMSTAAVEPDHEPAAVVDAGPPEFRWPARGRITEGYRRGTNDGINISLPEGTDVKAAEAGVVVYAGNEVRGYGNLVLIRHPNGFVTAYADNGELNVKRGQVVRRGQLIAKSGETGNATSPQLHFEVRKGSTPVDPTQYLAGL